MQSELKHQVKAIIANCLAVTDPQFEDDTKLVNELYFDSLELMDLVLGLNEQFGINIGGDEVVGLVTVSDVYREVELQLVVNGVTATESAPVLKQ